MQYDYEYEVVITVPTLLFAMAMGVLAKGLHCVLIVVQVVVAHCLRTSFKNGTAKSEHVQLLANSRRIAESQC